MKYDNIKDVINLLKSRVECDFGYAKTRIEDLFFIYPDVYTYNKKKIKKARGLYHKFIRALTDFKKEIRELNGEIEELKK